MRQVSHECQSRHNNKCQMSAWKKASPSSNSSMHLCEHCLLARYRPNRRPSQIANRICVVTMAALQQRWRETPWDIQPARDEPVVNGADKRRKSADGEALLAGTRHAASRSQIEQFEQGSPVMGLAERHWPAPSPHQAQPGTACPPTQPPLTSKPNKSRAKRRMHAVQCG